jgi:hypothetical protein
MSDNGSFKHGKSSNDPKFNTGGIVGDDANTKNNSGKNGFGSVKPPAAPAVKVINKSGLGALKK